MKEKKPIYKKWWFWVIIVIVLIIAIGSCSSNSDDAASNPIMDCKVKTTDVKSGSGDVIGTRAYVEFSEEQFNKLTDEQIAEFALNVVNGADYNYFTIDFGNNRGVTFPGCMIICGSIGEIDDTGCVLKSEKTLCVSEDGTCSIESNPTE